MKFFTKKNNLLLIIVDVSASTGAFIGKVCLIAVRSSVWGRTGCRGCGRVRVGKTPRLSSLTFMMAALRMTVITSHPPLSGSDGIY